MSWDNISLLLQPIASSLRKFPRLSPGEYVKLLLKDRDKKNTLYSDRQIRRFYNILTISEIEESEFYILG